MATKATDTEALKEHFSALSFDEQRKVLDDLTTLHEQAKDAKRQELLAELEKLGGLPKPARATSKAGAPSEGKTRAKASVQYRGPNGETYAGRGPMPNWAKDLGLKNKAEMEQYRI